MKDNRMLYFTLGLICIVYGAQLFFSTFSNSIPAGLLMILGGLILLRLIVKYVKDKQNERLSVFTWVLLLTSVFSIGYLGINRVVFSNSATMAILGIRPENQMRSGEFFQTETADENNDDWSWFDIDRLVSWQDHYLTRVEAEQVIAGIFSWETGLEFDFSEAHFGLLHQLPDVSKSMWITTTGIAVNDRIYDIAIDAVTGELIEFIVYNHNMSIFTTVEHNGITFEILADEQDEHIELLSPVEAAIMVADYLFENFEITLEDLQIELIRRDDSSWDGGIYWNVWIWQIEESGSFSVIIDAETGEFVEVWNHSFR